MVPRLKPRKKIKYPELWYNSYINDIYIVQPDGSYEARSWKTAKWLTFRPKGTWQSWKFARSDKRFWFLGELK